MRSWVWQRWAAAACGTVAAALAIGIPTGIIETPFYTRMMPVIPWNYPVWLVSSLLTGLVIATYVRPPADVPRTGGRAGLGAVLSVFAVGCPVCNKLVVFLIGLTGALNVWAPLQPLLGVASVALLAFALSVRLRGERACRAPAALDSQAPEVPIRVPKSESTGD